MLYQSVDQILQDVTDSPNDVHMKSTAIEGLDSTNPEESKIVVLITDDSPSRSSEIKEPFDIISTKNTNAEPRDGDGVSVR